MRTRYLCKVTHHPCHCALVYANQGHPERLWVNPDCGLKTRTWDEVLPSLAAMERAAAAMRVELAAKAKGGAGAAAVAAEGSAAPRGATCECCMAMVCAISASEPCTS